MSDREHHLANVISGTLLGALVGAGLGLGVCVFVFEDSPLFTGDTILIGALFCGVLGYVLGEDFVEWLKNNWWWFW